jgi:hypothetical protein
MFFTTSANDAAPELGWSISPTRSKLGTDQGFGGTPCSAAVGSGSLLRCR